MEICGVLMRLIIRKIMGLYIISVVGVSVPQHGNHVYSVVLDAYNNEWILTDKGCFCL